MKEQREEKHKMKDRVIKNNRVTITGEIVSELSYSHSVHGEGFYMTNVKSTRISGNYDVIPVTVSDRLMDINTDYRGNLVTIYGQFRSYNRHENDGNHLILSVFAREIDFWNKNGEISECNQIFLDGYVCKEPVYRHTQLGREVTDILIAANRPYGKTDYIPCICWGRNARYSKCLAVGERCTMSGRIQSRKYWKKISETKYDERMAYEVSCKNLELFKEGDNRHE